ncbi:MAG: hypothetical protein LBV77_07145 [Candidatus Adiutrix intracellularis]|nr:hypothetical protein [Candidatus Adiutrix intracellularis]
MRIVVEEIGPTRELVSYILWNLYLNIAAFRSGFVSRNVTNWDRLIN